MLKKIALCIISLSLFSACEPIKASVAASNKEQKTLNKIEQKKLATYKNDLLISALTVENNNDLLFISKRLKALNNGTLDHMVIVRLFTKQNSMNKTQQQQMMEIVQGNMSEVHLATLKPLLNSQNENVAITAFSLLSELELSREIKKIYLSLSHSSSSKLVRIEAKNRATRRR